MKQNKGRGVVLMDRTAYLEKCLDILDANQFTKLSTDPTKKTEEKIQRVLRKTEGSFQRRGIQPYIPQDHFRESSMAQPKFISYQEMEMWTSYLLDQSFLI